MKMIPEAALLRAELTETRRELSATQAAGMKLRSALDDTQGSLRIAQDCLAIMLHRSGEAVVDLSETEKRAAWDDTWLRVCLDIIEHDEEDVGNSIRLALVPVTDAERAKNEQKRKP